MSIGTWEDVTRGLAGHDTATGEAVYEVTRHGRMRRPASVAEWSAQRAAALGLTVRAMPAGRAVTALLEAGEDFDVKAAGMPLDEYQRYGVLLELTRLLEAAREGYPPASPLMLRLRGAWVRAWGDRVARSRQAWVVRADTGRARVLSMADDPPDAASVGASWGALTAAVPYRRERSA